LFSLVKELKPLFGDDIGLIYGGQKNEERESTLARAQTDSLQCICATISAGGVGVNLHSRPGQRLRCSFISPSFSSAEVKQCLGRCHRAGGTRSVQSFVLLAKTVEENVHRAIQGKMANLDALNSLLDDQTLMGI